MTMNPVVHFEMPADDRQRMSDFYTTVFGWQTQQLDEDYGDYVTAMTTESDKNGPKKPGIINGGFFQRGADSPNQHPSLVIAVDDVDEHIKKVEAGGGTVLGEPMDIPNVGRYVSLKDTEGNLVSMLKPAPRE